MTYPALSVTTRSVLRELDEQDRVRSERPNVRSISYNDGVADNAGDSGAAANRIDSTIAPSGLLSPGSGGVSRDIEGIVR